VKGISIKSYISNLFFIRFEIEINGDRVSVEEKETIMRCGKKCCPMIVYPYKRITEKIAQLFPAEWENA